MSQPSPPPYGATPSPYSSRPPKPRPRARWFVIGGALLLVALAAFVGTFVFLLGPLSQEDAVFSAAQTPVEVDLPADSERALFVEEGRSAQCSATDGSGAEVELRSVGGDFTYNEWTAVSQFDTADGQITFDCAQTPAASDIRIGQVPTAGEFVGGLLVGILGSLVFGVAGLAVLVVTGILYATRPARPQPGAA